MKKILIVLILIGSLTMVSLAQSSDYNKGEVFGGFAANTDDDNSALRGFNGSAVYNFHQYFGIKAEGSATFRDINNSAVNWSRRFYNGAVGVQFKNNDPEKVFKPFAHALVGYGQYSSKAISNCAGCTPFETVQKGATLTVGGGFDIKVNRRIDIRPVQLDITRIFSSRFAWTNARFSAGVVFKF
ncbi:MAG TPA: outer membrane beta-barrel protein [Pyrinomonadaceae bacterium]|nr:outer membrane beta-barrel protein [Pyrinomonadaceae bacterium]